MGRHPDERATVKADSASTVVGIDWLVAGARGDAPLAEQVEWLEQFCGWLRAGRGSGSVAVEGEADGNGRGASPATRLRFFLGVLERHPDRRVAVGQLLRATMREMDGIGLMCDTGLPRGTAFFQELAGRIAMKLLPTPPAPNDLGALFGRLFPDERDAQWIATLPAATLDGLVALFHVGDESPGAGPWSRLGRDADDALVILASHVQAIGMSQRVRQRTSAERPLDSPFAGLSAAVHEFVEMPNTGPEFVAAHAAVKSHIARCVRALMDVASHLSSYGLSIDLVYQVERARLSLERMEDLAGLRAAAIDTVDTVASAHFAASLIRANAAQRSIKALLAENTMLMTRRIVESARKTGDHYITRDGAEYRAMLVSAAVGGAVTGATVIVKIVTVGHGLPPFLEGLVASANYALSFVLIHFLHGTLATKQPAMTAATLAEHLNAAHRKGQLRGFVAEVAGLVRSQVAAIAGNLLLVVPAALLLQALLLAIGVGHLPRPEESMHYVEGLSLWSATPLFAALTGVLLWLSAVCAGWFENWATYRHLPEAIGQSRAVRRWLGDAGAARFAAIVDNNLAALGGNVSLGILLGMLPVVALFFGPPLEVRHVTLSTGQLALASWSHGPGIFALAAFWWAVVGIGVIGFLNLTVSFALALWVAIRSTGRGVVSRRRLRRAVLAHLVASPRDFLLPPRTG
jgi:site-specific recombinase